MAVPLYALPRTLTGVNHFRITYADASTALGVIAPGTYYLTGSVDAYDLIEAFLTALGAAETKGNDWVVANATSGLPFRTEISASGGTSTPTKITFLTDELTSRDLGLAASPGSPDDVTLTAGAKTGTYQRRWIWTPGEELAVDAPDPQHWVPGARSRTSANAVLHHLGTVTDRLHRATYLHAARFFELYRADSNYAAQVAGLSTSDPNFTLERFLADYLGLISDGTAPSVAYYADSEAWAVGKELLAWTDPDHLSSVRQMLRDGNAGPLLFHVELRFREV